MSLLFICSCVVVGLLLKKICVYFYFFLKTFFVCVCMFVCLFLFGLNSA